MPPGAGPGKRKRADGSDASTGRPSPHRPQDMNLARHQDDQYRSQPGYGGRGPRRGRGGRGGHGGRNAGTPFDSPTNSRRQSRDIVPSDAPQTEPSTPQPQQASSQQQQPNMAPPPPRRLPTPEPPPLPTEALEPPAYYHYTVLTEERLESWDAEGKAQVLEHTSQAFADDDYAALSITFQELIQAGMYGKLSPRDAGSFVKEILASAPSESPLHGPSVFLDTFDTSTEGFEWKHAAYDWKNQKHFPEIRYLQNILSFTEIPLQLIREILDASLLEALGLVRLKSFKGNFIRKQTDALYKTGNFNLLREESEGYSKLVIEFATSLDASTISKHPWSYTLVKPLLGNIQALVGAFRLDAARTLDVILDVSAPNLIAHCRFIIRFLRLSSYWPAERNYELTDIEKLGPEALPMWALPDHDGWFLNPEEEEELATKKLERDVKFWDRARQLGVDAFFELGQRRVMSNDEILERLTPEQVNDARFEESRKWIETTKTLPPPGNEVAAQLLGQKLRFHFETAEEDRDVQAEKSLIFLCALLIKVGFISLRDLYTHLHPTDSAMEQVREQQEGKKAEEDAKRNGGGANPLAAAGALTDDSLAPPLPLGRPRPEESRANTPSRGEPPASNSASASATANATTAKSNERAQEGEKKLEPQIQKVDLLRQLLLLGALPEALYIIGRFPWILNLFPDLPEYINRLIHQSISELYEPLNALDDRPSISEPACYPVTDHSNPIKGSLKLLHEQPRRKLRWPRLERYLDQGIDYRFYWEDWADNVPICRTVDDFFTLCNTFLNASGIKIGQDAPLLTKIARIGKDSLTKDPSESNLARWADLCKRLLCPALSLTDADTPVVNEIWGVLKLFPTRTRYNIYTEWYSGPTSRKPDIAAAMKRTEREAKKVLKKMSADKDQIRHVARQLAKVACASPGKVFESSIRQLESYPNMITVFVEGGRYFTFLGYDVLGWTLLTALAKDRARIASTGLTISPWLQALSDLSGQLFRRYSHMNPLPILQYVLVQLKQGVFPNLRVLKEMIQEMAGIGMGFEFNDKQLSALGGGPELRKLVHLEVKDRRYESKTSAKRLLKVLVDNHLAGPFVVAIAQARQTCIFNTQQDSLKLIAENFDDMHQNLMQYCEFLLSNLTMEEFESIIPSIVTMVGAHGIDPGIAFTIHRQSLGYILQQTSTPASQPISHKRSPSIMQAEKVALEGDVEMRDANEAVEEETNGDVAMVGVEDSSPKIDEMKEIPAVWNPILHDLASQLKPLLPADFESSLSLMFYVTFWQLSIYDIVSPSEQYSEAHKRTQDRIDASKKDRRDISAAAVKRREQDQKDFVAAMESLKKEASEHLTHWQLVRKRLTREKPFWFASLSDDQDALNEALLQECFLPRLALSPMDSIFASKFLFLLHSTNTPGFKLPEFLDQLFEQRSLANLIFQFTGREAENFGRFLSDILNTLVNWHSSKAIYELGALGKTRTLLGFALEVADGKPSKFVEYEPFRAKLLSWHNNIFHALKICLKPGGEYMHIHNALKILKSISVSFPKVTFHGKGLLDTLTEMATEEAPPDRQNGKREGEGRQDLSVLTNSVIAAIKPHSASWVMPQDFRQHDTKPKDAKKPAQNKGKPSLASETSTSGTSMNPQAKDFRPRVDTSSIARPANAAREDGEISATPKTDVKMGAKINGVSSAAATGTSTPSAASEMLAPPTEPSRASSASAPRSERDIGASGSGRTTPLLPSKPDIRRPDAGRSLSQTGQVPARRVEHQQPRDPLDARVAQDRYGDRGPDSRHGTPQARPSEAMRGDRVADRPRDMTRDRERQPYVEERGRINAHEIRPETRPLGRELAPERYPRNGPPRNEPPDAISSRPNSRASTDGPRGPLAPMMHPTRDAGHIEVDRSGRIADGLNDARPAYNADRSSFQGPEGSSRDIQRRYPSPRRDLRPVAGGPGEFSQDMRERNAMGRNGPPDPQTRRAEYATEVAPNGPRISRQPPMRSSGHDWSRGDNHELMGPPSRPHERSFPDHSRPQPQHQDPNYGRLNQDPTPVSPTAPRNLRSGPNAMPLAAAPTDVRRSNGNRGPSDITQAPTPRRSDSFHTQSQTASSPTTPSGVDAGGVHPDRLRQWQGDEIQAPQRALPPQQSGRNPASAPFGRGPTGTGPLPAGPRGQLQPESPIQNTMQGPVAGRGPPSGPSINRPPEQRKFNRAIEEQPYSGHVPSNALPSMRGGPPMPEDDRGTSIRGRASLGTTPSGPIPNGLRPGMDTGAERFDDRRGPRYDTRRGEERDMRHDDNRVPPPYRAARDQLPPRDFAAREPPRREYPRNESDFGRLNPNMPPAGPPGPIRREGGGDRRDLLSGSGRKRDWNGEGAMQDDKRPRRSGGGGVGGGAGR